MAVPKKKAKTPAKTSALPRSVQRGIQKVVADFFDNHEIKEADEHLWQWLVEALSREHSIYNSAKERASLIFFYENLKKFLNDLWLLNTANKDSA